MSSGDINPTPHWLSNYLIKEWRVIKSAPVSFITFFVLGTLSVFSLFTYFVIPGKDSELRAKEAIIHQLKVDLDHGKGALGASPASSLAELRTEAKVLAKQLRESAETDTDLFDVYLKRFRSRVPDIVNRLDIAGQHSFQLDKVEQGPGGHAPDANYFRAVAAEIEKMADNLPLGTP